MFDPIVEHSPPTYMYCCPIVEHSPPTYMYVHVCNLGLRLTYV